MQLADLRGLKSRGYWPAESFAILPGMGQTSPGSFPQNLSFELGEDGQQTGHRATGWRSEVECLSQRYETDSEILEFLERRNKIRDGA